MQENGGGMEFALAVWMGQKEAARNVKEMAVFPSEGGNRDGQ